MNSYEKHLQETIERSIAMRSMPLAELIESEHLRSYVRGRIDVLSVDETSVAMVPCRGYMILARDRYDGSEHDFIAEYAIYRRAAKDSFDDDITSMSGNTFICEAVYNLEFVGEETFENNAYAIKYAVELIEKISDDPMDIVREMTDGDPLKDLTEEDAVHLIAEAVNRGYAVPANLTPEMFLEIYNDLKPEKEE